jgi:hypothetical protein
MTRATVVLLVLWALFFAGCFNSNSTSPVYEKTGKEAFVFVVENNKGLAKSWGLAFEFYRDTLTLIMADVFGIPRQNMDGMNLEQIMDVYGAEWQIREITNAASPYYTRIVTLTDSMAAGGTVLDTLQSLAAEGFIIDMIFNLDGIEDSVRFDDSTYGIQDFTDSIRVLNVPVRALYQTCSYGSWTIDEWESTGIVAVNGANGYNTFVIYSPLFFLQNWTQGMTFKASVDSAFEQEIDKITSYRTILPEIESFINPEVIANCTQQVGGKDTTLLWRDFSF